MIQLSDVKNAFSELSELKPVNNVSGQRHVLFGENASGNKVALKIFKDFSQITEQRLIREVGAVQKLGCTYVPRIYDFGKRRISGYEVLFVIEEWIEGQSYRETLIGQPEQDLNDVLILARFLLNACVDFEEKNFVHRDIKPDNILMDTRGGFWLLDFGIIRALDLISLTQTASPQGLGTLGYWSPEQMKNIKAKIDIRSDLFSIGIVMYEALKGFNPYTNGKANILQVAYEMEHVDLPPLDIPQDQDGSVSDFIASLGNRFPSRRPQSAIEAIEWYKPIFENYVGPYNN